MDMTGGLSPGLSKPHHYHSADEGSGSCTSASSSSMFSPEYSIASCARPSVVGLWNDDSCDDEVPPAARTKLFMGRSLKGKKSATRLIGPTSPLAMSCNTNAFSSSPDSSPVQPHFLSASTSAVEGRSIPGGLQSPVEDYFSRRPQSARKRTPNDRFATSPHELFLTQCNSRGFELTPRPDGPRSPAIPMSDDIAHSDHSPLRHGATAAHALPLSPSAPLLSRRQEGALQLHLTPRNRSPASVSRSKSNRGARSLPARPTLRRGLTEPANKTPKAPPVPQLGTPVSELFGDEKPSPAAFSSTGLIKKRGARLNIPRFAAKLKAPQPLSFDDKPKRPAAQADAPTSGSDTETDDSEGDQLSPIKPLRSGPFRMSLNSTRTHSRNGSLASDIASSPFRRSHGHARMSSTASSIGGSKGLRRKSSAMFTSAGSIASDTEFSPATPTKPLPLAREYQSSK